MTTVRMPTHTTQRRIRAAGKLLLAVLVVVVTGHRASAQGRPVHPLHAGVMPPGAIGSHRLVGSGPLSGHMQPVEVRAPKGTKVAFLEGTTFAVAEPAPLAVGLQVGSVYRFQLTEIPGYPGVELFPTIELLDCTKPPPGKELKFPIPAEFTREDLQLAIQGAFVTRVIYVEDPQHAAPVAQPANELAWFDATPGSDPLMVADELGRPVAILRIGGRTPAGQGTAQSPFPEYGAVWTRLPKLEFVEDIAPGQSLHGFDQPSEFRPPNRGTAP